MHEIRLMVSADHRQPGVTGWRGRICLLQPLRARHGFTAAAAEHFVTGPRGLQSSALLIQHLAEAKPAKSEEGDRAACPPASRTTGPAGT